MKALFHILISIYVLAFQVTNDNTQQFNSASGQWKASIDQSSITMRCGEDVVWSYKVNFDPVHCIVTDTGFLFGYYLEGGRTGLIGGRLGTKHEDDQLGARMGVFLIDSSGRLIGSHESRRGKPGYGATPVLPASPLIVHICTSKSQQNLLVWKASHSYPWMVWHVYRSSDLGRLETIIPDVPDAIAIEDSERIVVKHIEDLDVHVVVWPLGSGARELRVLDRNGVAVHAAAWNVTPNTQVMPRIDIAKDDRIIIYDGNDAKCKLLMVRDSKLVSGFSVVVEDCGVPP